MHPLHIIISPIPFIARFRVISSSCLPLPFISLALSDDDFLQARLFHSQAYCHRNIIRLLWFSVNSIFVLFARNTGAQGRKLSKTLKILNLIVIITHGRGAYSQPQEKCNFLLKKFSLWSFEKYGPYSLSQWLINMF